MAELELKIINGKIVSSLGIFNYDIGVKNERIVAIGEHGTLPDAEKTVDAKVRLIFTGGIDTHCHSVDPGFEMFGIDFKTATQGAALGGITTVVDMPLQMPPTIDSETFDIKYNSIKPKAYVDFALWGTSDPENVDTIVGLKKKGIVGYKFFMQASVGESTPRHNDGILYEALKEAKKTGLPVYLHCENQEMIQYLEDKFKKEGKTSPFDFFNSRPYYAETEAISRALHMAREIGVEIHVAHCSTPEGLELIDQAKRSGVKVTVETCPHYLILDESVYAEKGPYSKIAPPIRSKENAEAMWASVKAGKVTNIASDHVPATRDLKENDNIWEVMAGVPGIETLFPLMLYQCVKENRISLEQLADLISEGPARFCGIYPRKGSFEIGSDADFSIFDPENVQTIRGENLESSDWTLFEDMKAIFPETVIVRGSVVVENQKLIGEPGKGQLITP